MKLELTLTDNMIRDRIRKVRLAYGRDPQCMACSPEVKEKLDELYADRMQVTSIYTGERLYGIPVLICTTMFNEDLLFLMDIDNLQPSDDMLELGELPEVLS